MIGMLAAALVFGLAGSSSAMTADGAVITTTASLTYGAGSGWSGDNLVGFSVSYCATARAIARNPAALVSKTVSPTAQTTGGTMTYTIWVVNYGSASAFSISAVDPFPSNVHMDGLRGTWPGLSGGAWTQWSGTSGSSWAAGMPLVGQGAPYYLRFVLDMLGPGRSAMQAYSVVIL